MLVENMEVLISVVDSLAWPVTTLVLALIFRIEVRALLARLSHLKVKDAEATFGRELEKVEREIEKLTVSAPSRPSPPPRTLMQPELQRLRHLASVSPRSGVMEAYLVVEVALFDAAAALGIKTRGFVIGGEVIEALIASRIFDNNHRITFEHLRRLRNQAAHGPDFEIPIDEVERYVDLCLQYVEEIKIGIELWKSERKG